MSKRVWSSLSQKVSAYEEVLQYMQKNNVTLEQAYDALEFYSEERLSKSEIIELSVQYHIGTSEFIPV